MTRLRRSPRWPNPHPLALLLAALSVPSAQAQSTPAAEELSPVNVTATRTEKSMEALPPSVTTTGRDTLDDNLVDNYSDLSKLIPGVDISHNGRYGFTNVNIRGLDGNRVLMLVDGIRLPDTFEFQGRDSRVGQDLVDFNSLSAIDVVRGPGSTLYGSSALAGIVGLRTLNPDDILKPGRTLGGLAKGDYIGADDSIGTQAALAGRATGSTSWLIQLGQRKGHEYETRGENDSRNSARTVADPQDTTRRNALLKLQHAFGGGHKLGVTAEWFERKADTDLLSNRGSLGVLDSRATDEQRRQRYSLEYDYTAPSANSPFDTASARIYHQRLDSNQHRFEVRGTAPDYQREGRYEQSMNGISGQLTKRIGGAISQHWVVGGEWWRADTTEFAAGNPPSATINLRTIPKTKNSQWGLFADNELRFGDGSFTLTPGLRFDRYSIDPEIDSVLADQIQAGTGSRPAQQSDSQLSPKLAANWKLAPRASLFAQYAHGFRAPNIVEVNGQFSNGRAYTLVPNANIKPETSRSFELGARLGDRKLGGSVTVFDSRFRNFILMDTLSPGDTGYVPGYGSVFQYRNVADARIYGTELAGHAILASNWRVDGNLAWLQGSNRSEHTWLDTVPSLKTSVAVTYLQETWGAQARLTAAKAKTKTASPNGFSAPGYGIVDLTAWWNPMRDLRVSLALYNVFDRKYWNGIDALTYAQPAGSAIVDRYSLPGRHLRAALTYQF